MEIWFPRKALDVRLRLWNRQSFPSNYYIRVYVGMCARFCISCPLILSGSLYSTQITNVANTKQQESAAVYGRIGNMLKAIYGTGRFQTTLFHLHHCYNYLLTCQEQRLIYIVIQYGSAKCNTFIISFMVTVSKKSWNKSI